MKAILEKGPTIDALTPYGWTALHLAAFWGNQEIVKQLLDKGAGVNVKTSQEKETPLHFAINHNRKEVVEILLDRGAGIDISSEEGPTPLRNAVEKGFHTLVDLLLRRGAKIDVQDHKGETPLYEALQGLYGAVSESINNKISIMQLLLQYGAYSDPNANVERVGQRLRFRVLLLENTESCQLLCTFSLLAGVSEPMVMLSAPLRIIQNHIEATVFAWLLPLDLSSKECATLTPSVLRALPQLLKWVDTISCHKAQTFGRVLCEALISSKSPDTVNAALRQSYHYKMTQKFKPESQDKKLLEALQELPQEMRDAVQEAYAPLPLIGLVADQVQVTYDLPSEVATYLANNSWNYTEEYAAFHREIFTHDWFTRPCAPPGKLTALQWEFLENNRADTSYVGTRPSR